MFRTLLSVFGLLSLTLAAGIDPQVAYKPVHEAFIVKITALAPIEVLAKAPPSPVSNRCLQVLTRKWSGSLAIGPGINKQATLSGSAAFGACRPKTAPGFLVIGSKITAGIGLEAIGL